MGCSGLRPQEMRCLVHALGRQNTPAHAEDFLKMLQVRTIHSHTAVVAVAVVAVAVVVGVVHAAQDAPGASLRPGDPYSYVMTPLA